MRQASFPKVVLALALILINTCAGCTTRDNGTRPAAGEKTDRPSGPRVLSTDDHNAVFNRILVDHRVESCRRMFESRGLGVRPAASFTVEGTNEEGARAQVTVMVFAGADSSIAGVLAFISGKGQSRVRAAVLRTANGRAVSGDTPVVLTEYSALDDERPTAFEAVSGDTTGGEGSGFWTCVGANSVAGTVVCTLKCLPAGPLYADCLIACTGWAILTAIITCAFAELISDAD